MKDTEEPELAENDLEERLKTARNRVEIAKKAALARWGKSA